jgi:F-type H+-transporting ATPase subunit b
MALSPLNILIYIINIVVLYLLLRVLLYKPIRKFLDKREQKIQAQLTDAEEAQKKAHALLEQYQAQLAQAEEEAKKITQEGTVRAAEAASQLIADARQQAEEILAAARAKEQEEQKRALREMRTQIANMAVDLAAQVLKREVRLEDNRMLIDAFFQERE